MIARDDIPYLPRGVRLHYDKVRENWVLLAPERSLMLDSIGHAILAEVDGQRAFHAITETLAAKYDAPAEEIAKDANGFLTGLKDRRYLELQP